MKAGTRACEYKNKLMDSDGRTIVQTYLKERESVKGEFEAVKERGMYLKRCGWS